MCSSMSQKTINITFFTDHCPGTVFLPDSQYISLLGIVFFNQVRRDKPMFSPFVNNFFKIEHASPCSLHIILQMS